MKKVLYFLGLVALMTAVVLTVLISANNKMKEDVATSEKVVTFTADPTTGEVPILLW